MPSAEIRIKSIIDFEENSRLNEIFEEIFQRYLPLGFKFWELSDLCIVILIVRIKPVISKYNLHWNFQPQKR